MQLELLAAPALGLVAPTGTGHDSSWNSCAKELCEERRKLQSVTVSAPQWQRC